MLRDLDIVNRVKTTRQTYVQYLMFGWQAFAAWMEEKINVKTEKE